MNNTLKLVIAFIAGVVITALFNNAVYNANTTTVTNEEPSVDEPAVSTSTPVIDGDEVTPDASAAQAPRTTPISISEPSPQTYTPPPPQYPTSALVTFTGSRFIPETVVVIEGGIVTFRNNSQGDPMHIITNSHALHDKYPEKNTQGCTATIFDQCASVGPGGRWTFQFNETGGWRYHDENKPVTSGTVRVLSKEDYDKEF